jgi:hypothetical protein
MSIASVTTGFESSILSRVIDPARADWSPAAAEAILALTIAPEDKQRMNELAGKARAGTLSPDEELEIESYRQIGRILDLLKARARASLPRTT